MICAADQVNVGAKVTQRPTGIIWRRGLSRSTEFDYCAVNLRDNGCARAYKVRISQRTSRVTLIPALKWPA